mmetsp:Transcript_45775/g.115755  ORF Transcript_45775/g.115755 Transcript_45775/m.115755 type:complete len:244 (+) Transcript_45775:279-1010(+)
MPVAERPAVSTPARGLPTHSRTLSSPAGPLNRRHNERSTPDSAGQRAFGRPGAGWQPTYPLQAGERSTAAGNANQVTPSRAATPVGGVADKAQKLLHSLRELGEQGSQLADRTPGSAATEQAPGQSPAPADSESIKRSARMEWNERNIAEALQSLRELQQQAEAITRHEDAPTPPPRVPTAPAAPGAPPREEAPALRQPAVASKRVQAGNGALASAGAELEREHRMSMLHRLRALQKEALELL